ncbi:MAG TPA: hypothetical protein VGK32_03320 [Vicinamibacterales bacterium]
MRDLVEANLLHDLLAVAHLEHLTRLPDREPVPGHVERPEIVAHRHQSSNLVQLPRRSVQWPHRLRGLAEQRELLRLAVICGPGHCFGGFVRQTDADERTSGALRAVPEGCRQRALLRHRPGGAHGGKRFVDEKRVDRHADALLGLVVVEHRFVARVAGIAENQRLHADLHTVRRPGFGTVHSFARPAALVVHR